MENPARIGIITNLTKPDAVSRTREVVQRLRQAEAEVYLEEATAAACHEPGGLPLPELADAVEVVVVCGGDGTILRTALLCGDRVKPLAGLNTGRLGFLTSATESQLDKFADALARRDYHLSERSVISVEFVSRDGKRHSLSGLNEVTITRGAISRLIRLEVSINGMPLNRFNGDGLIIATPTGSTAYSLSAGGPIVGPKAEVFLITPICAHALASRAFVTEDSVTLTIRDEDQRQDILLTVDGGTPQALQPASTVTLRKALYRVPLVVLGQTTFYGVLQEKLRWMGSEV